MGPEKEKVGFIGDSITKSPARKSGAVDVEMAVLKNRTAINRGVSGTTTTDWLPGRALFDDTLAIFRSQNVHTVSIMLGTNDSRSDKATSPTIYRRNMERIVAGLLNSGVVQLVIINYPPYVTPGSHDTWTKMSVDRLERYSSQLDMITQKKGVARGDTEAFAYFRVHSNLFLDGVHPNAKGDDALGTLWARAYKKVIDTEASRHRATLFAALSISYKEF